MPELKILEDACSGLLMPSESDAEFLPFVWPDAASMPLTEAQVRQFSGQPSDAVVEQVELEYLLRNVAYEKDWHDSTQQELVLRFQNLIQTLKEQLSQIQVFRVGAINIQVFIVGQFSSGEVGGLSTYLVET